MKVQTSTLTGAALDWAVAKCIGQADEWMADHRRGYINSSSTDWSQGGPIIEREKISVQELEGVWSAFFRDKLFEEDNSECWRDGPTPLIAAMRAFVASRLGDEVDVPEELL